MDVISVALLLVFVLVSVFVDDSWSGSGCHQGRCVHRVRIIRITSGVVSVNAIIIFRRSAEACTSICRDIRRYRRDLCKRFAVTGLFDLEPCFVVRLIVPRQVNLVR